MTLDNNVIAQKKIKQLKTYIAIISIGCIILTAIIANDLISLEKGEVDSVNFWAPIIYTYNHFGLAPAILFMPVFGLIIALLALRQIKKLKKSST